MAEESSKKRLKEKRSKAVEVVFSEEELTALDQRRGEVPRARFLREIALEQKPARLTSYKKTDPDLIRALNKIGGNLNQIAYFINRQDDDVYIAEKLAVLQDLSFIRDALNDLREKDDAS